MYQEFYFSEKFQSATKELESSKMNGLLWSFNHQNCIFTHGVRIFIPIGTIHSVSDGWDFFGGHSACQAVKCRPSYGTTHASNVIHKWNSIECRLKSDVEWKKFNILHWDQHYWVTYMFQVIHCHGQKQSTSKNQRKYRSIVNIRYQFEYPEWRINQSESKF